MQQKMSGHSVNILDLPNEILLIILRKLRNVDILYSFLGINDTRLDIVAQEKSFSDILDFEYIDNIPLINRFTTDILPKIGHNVECFILQPSHMDRILFASVYPNLTEIKLFNFDQQIALKYFTDESPFRSVFQEQIKKLTIVHNDKSNDIGAVDDYTRNVYGHTLNFFRKLEYLNVTESLSASYPGLSLRNLPSTTFHSSILTRLYIHLETFDDCLCLLDGRLTQLVALSVTVYAIDESAATLDDTDTLLNLKYFSLKSMFGFRQFGKITSLLRQLVNLENLILYLRTTDQNRIVDGTLVQNDILFYMPRLQSFIFYISTEADPSALLSKLSHEDVQKTWINIGRGKVSSIMNYVYIHRVSYSTFSLPFAFDYLVNVGNMFPDIIFNRVTYLVVRDSVVFRHEFFVRIARSFPLLKHLGIFNMVSPSFVDCFASLLSGHIPSLSSDRVPSYRVVEYLHLTSLNAASCRADYLDQFLNETKAYVPCLTILTVSYDNLKTVTENFTREATRRNSGTVKQLIISPPLDNAEDHSDYFPSLQM